MFERLKSLISGANIAGATAAPKTVTDTLILEILDGKWGSGDTRKTKLTKAGYNYDAVQKRVNEVVAKMKTRKEAMKPWFDACKEQEQWSYNARYNWGKWSPRNIAKSKEFGTCITYPNSVAMRCGLIKEPAQNILTSSGSNNDNQKTLDSFWDGSVKAMKSVNAKYWSSIKYPNKDTKTLVKEGKIKEGDIIGFMGHTTSYAGKDKNGNLLFNNAGHAAGIYDDKPGSNRAVLNQKSSYMANRKVYGVFSVNTFIVITNCTGGTITASDRYMAGQNVKITIKPNAGMVVKSITVDGKAVTAANTYTISKIDSHHIINVICGTVPKKKTIDELALEVLDGKWGAGETRKEKLTKAGYNYDAVQKRVNEILEEREKRKQKPYQNLDPKKYISNTVTIGQATCDENGKTTGGKPGDQTGKEVATSSWTYSSKKDTYNNWQVVFRAKNEKARLAIAQAAIDACSNNHIGYDTNAPDRKSFFKEAQKVNFWINTITTNCETTCSELANVCIAAAGLSSYLPITKNAYVASLKSTLNSSNEFVKYTDASYTSKNNKLVPGDILISDTHTAIVVKAPASKSNKYTGPIPTLRLKKTNAEVIADTIKWAKWIAGDNRFHYGYGQHAHHNGCYFCGTQRMKKNRTPAILDPDFTYCCNPFVGAAWAHGGCVPTAISLCRNTNSWDFSLEGGNTYEKAVLFTKLGKPAISQLKAGDVLCGDSHVALYIGNGKVIQASGGDDNVRNSKKWNNSIAIGTWSGWKRAYRFNGSVDADVLMRHGEVSKRVALWQAFLDWYYDGKVGSADGYFGDNTLKWTKKFQEEVIGKGEGDGVCGNKTFEAAKNVVKK